MKKELEQWVKDRGLENFEDSECLVNQIEVINEATIKVKVFMNVYMKNRDVFSGTAFLILRKREG